jgi:hypothetical protein
MSVVLAFDSRLEPILMKADSTDKERLRAHIKEVLKQLKSHLDAKRLELGQQAAKASDESS